MARSQTCAVSLSSLPFWVTEEQPHSPASSLEFYSPFFTEQPRGNFLKYKWSQLIPLKTLFPWCFQDKDPKVQHIWQGHVWTWMHFQEVNELWPLRSQLGPNYRAVPSDCSKWAARSVARVYDRLLGLVLLGIPSGKQPRKKKNGLPISCGWKVWQLSKENVPDGAG